MQNTLEKIFKFDKREKEESLEYSSFNDIISNMESVSVDEEQDTNDSIIVIVDIISGHLLSDTFDGKITLAAFNKFIKQHDIAINDDVLFNVLLSYFINEKYSSVYPTFINNLNRFIAQDKKTDFLHLILFSALKDIIVPTKNLNANTYKQVVDKLNKFLLLCIFNDWKKLGIISSTNLDNIKYHSVITRYLSTLKTALFNVYSKFLPETKNCFVIENKSLIDYDKKLSIILQSKNNSLAYQLRGSYTVSSLYEKYEKSYIATLHNMVNGGSSRFRLCNHIRTDAEILTKTCSLELDGVQIESQNYYYYSSSFLNGDFKLTISMQNVLQQGNIDYRSGIVGKDIDIFKRLKSLPLDNTKQLIRIYNKFGYKVVNTEGDIDYNNVIVPHIDDIYKYRHNAYCKLSLFNLKNMPFLQRVFLSSSSASKNYNSINKSLMSLISMINLASTELSFETIYSTRHDIFMPFIFFILDINYLFNSHFGNGHGAFHNPIFPAFSEETIANDGENIIINKWLNILIDNRNNYKNIEECTLLIEAYSNFKIEHVCILYRAFLNNLPFEETKGMSDDPNVFIVHFDNFINSVIGLTSACFENDNLVNSYDFSEFKYIHKAISRFNNKEEEV